jgi:hypothetical protein
MAAALDAKRSKLVAQCFTRKSFQVQMGFLGTATDRC